MAIYLALANFAGGLDWADRMSIGQYRELDSFEPFGLVLGVVAAVLIGVPLGTYAVLRYGRLPRAGVTAFVAMAIAIALLTAYLLVTVNLGISADGTKARPIIAPYLIFGSWAAAPAATLRVMQRLARNRHP